MALWQWIVIATSGAFVVSAAGALMLAAILGSISQDIARVLEAEPSTASRRPAPGHPRAVAGR
jgi:hypothetical protein